MKKIILLGITVILLLVGGCTTSTPGNSPSVTRSPVFTPAPYTVPEDALPMNTTVALGNQTNPFSVWIDSFELKPQSDNQTTVTIYVAAKNTGKQPIRFVWFSKLTDLNGNAYGGIGISHGGNGARTASIFPNNTEAARDYVVVNSDQELAALSKGAVLDVYFMEQKDNVTHSPVPDYHVTWAIDPEAIK